MAVKMRLRRLGMKKAPFYRVIVADSRSPRDGRFIEEIGYYNPLTEPAEIKIDATSVVIPVDGGTESVKFNSTQNWNADVKYNEGSAWCIVSPKSGAAGDAVITIEEPAVCLFEIIRLDKVIRIFPVISRLEQSGGKGMCDRVSYKSEFHELRCLTASNIRIAADTDTLRESSFPSIGIFIWASATFLHASVRPVASVPMTIAVPPFMSVS